ncbi:TetR/AcrR family transcriptional regulator [Aetokthonos hydrillicola Thurmond2011]|jgi:AcrR family transcriptional regulator|uniref:TetR/AcrR family transcriptional regulator n=1 Tax=Aetokthonos hydrillicola Thurmond2011 TaxID=2712845 RepID=A0AAP5IGU5_9CYAN|nr:TetR/AcrR family transcriptional regulator [Aetokthonos hydrillicola]MBO3457206.1 TetR/AcrR family transcriptional regulator [Aetokthonos hydrillicola CCALA 1050]MBW4587557.1 TetR/AcrR family transcriptional regulator [Aetokthonos hydrillicola CCALA 1050]MDR9900177.1 TetR/AcrR family transcriptional regulator [Aetokthonos hydrillicola Thurmond2011]
MSKDTVIAQLREVFRRYGYEGTSLSKISEATGLGRASLYHYFPKGKEEMAATVLERVSAELEEHLLKPLQGKEKPITRIRAMGKTLSEFYNSGQSSCFIDILSIGEAQTLFQAPLRRTLTALIDAIAQVLIEAGQDKKSAHQHAEDALIQIQGALVLSRCLGNSKPFQRVIAKLPEILGFD